MRCPQCNKFVSQEMGDVEVNSLEIQPDGSATCDADIVVNCAECSSELKRGSFSIEQQLEDAEKHEGEGHELEINETDSEGIEDYQTKDRHGKEIRNPRYQKHLYGVRVSAEVKCSCDENWNAELVFEETMQASALDETA